MGGGIPILWCLGHFCENIPWYDPSVLSVGIVLQTTEGARVSHNSSFLAKLQVTTLSMMFTHEIILLKMFWCYNVPIFQITVPLATPKLLSTSHDWWHSFKMSVKNPTLITRPHVLGISFYPPLHTESVGIKLTKIHLTWSQANPRSLVFSLMRASCFSPTWYKSPWANWFRSLVNQGGSQGPVVKWPWFVALGRTLSIGLQLKL